MTFFFTNISLSFDTTYWLWAGGLSLLWIIQVLYYLILYNRPYAYEKKREKIESLKVERPSVSVIIVAENESENLASNLPFILEQDYSNYEVVVVNMGSTDETDTTLKLLGNKYPHLYHTYLPDGLEGVNDKKLALTLGIKAAKNDILLFTEPYCKPVSDKWIESFAQRFDDGKDIVLGFCKMNITKKFSGRKYVLYDNLFFGLKYLSMAILKRPFMGVGRNLAYKRDLFFEEKGFSSVLAYEYGDDDIYINRISKDRDVGVVLSPESMTEGNIVNSYRVWRNLRRKYLRSRKYYKGSTNFIFAIESLSAILFYIVFAGAVYIGITQANYELLVLSFLLFILRFIMLLFFINRYNRKLGIGRYGFNIIGFDIRLSVFSFLKVFSRK